MRRSLPFILALMQLRHKPGMQKRQDELCTLPETSSAVRQVIASKFDCQHYPELTSTNYSIRFNYHEVPHGNPLGQIHRQSAGSRPARERTRLRARQSRVAAVHLLAALLEDKEGIVPPVLEKIGIGPQAVLSDVYREIEKLPKVSGEAAQATLSNAANKLLEQAFKEASNFKDEYVSTEHLLLAITHLKRDAAQQILARHGATYDAILKALTVVRGSQKVTDQNPEAKYPGAGALRPRPDRAGPPRQARSRHRTRRRNPPRGPGSFAPHEK